MAGLGGLGHTAVKIAHALGAHVVAFTMSPDKKDDALRLGADEIIICSKPETVTQEQKSERRVRRLARDR